MKGPEVYKNLILLFILILLLPPVKHQGQYLYYSNGYYFEQFSKGVADANFYTLLQDSQGFIWAGNSGALVKCDGYTIEVFKPQKNIPFAEKIKSQDVTALEEGPFGNLWFGTTDNGLSRFDPESERFFHYPFVPDKSYSITEGSVTSIICDKQGFLWVGTEKGLNRVIFNPEQPDSIRVIQFHEAQDKNDALSQLNLLSNNITDLYLDQNQNLWIGTNKGLSKLDLKLSNDKSVDPDYNFKHFLPGDPNSGTIHFDYVTSISKGLSGTIWISGLKDGKSVCLDLYNPQTDKFHTLPFKDPLSKSITCIAQTRNGSLWLGTFGDGLKKIMVPNLEQRLQTENLPPVAYRSYSFKYWGVMAQNYIRTLLEDHSGALWIGTNYCYFYKFPISRSWFQYYEIPSINSDIPQITNSMEDSRGFLWLTTAEHGIYRWDKQTDEYVHYSHDPGNSKSIADNTVHFIFEDTRRRIWLATKKGLNRFDPKTGVFYDYRKFENAPTKQLYSIFEDSNGMLWLASLSQGLFIFDPEQEKFWRYEKDIGNAKALHADMIVQISEDDEGTIWISDFNLCKVVFPGKHLDYGNLSFQYLALGEHDAIVQIHIDQQKRFWASSDTEGLYLIDTKEEKIVKKYAQNEGNQLVGEEVFGIEEDAGGNLWLFGASGVEKFDPERETFELFDHTSGFSFNPSGRKVSKNKEGWYCTMSIKNGFYIFHPDSIETNRIPPDVLITQFRLFNQTVQPGEGSPLSKHISKTKTVQLKYNENDIAFEYTALHYDRTEKVKYAYKMKGIDEDWVTVGHERIARYPKLPPGNYTFQVKAANADGIWNEQGASLSISISKPWWNTWLAYVLYAIGGAGVVFFLYTSELKKKLQQAEAQRLAELNVVKTRLYTNITHEFRTPLTIILGMADQININPGEWLSEGMDMIKRSGKTLLHLVNQMLDLSKLESGVMPLHLIQGDIVVYLKYLFESFHSTAENKNIQLDFLAEPKSLRMDYDPDKLLNIVFNLMANAIKYTPQGGTITMEVFREGGGRQLLKLIVRDTGTGIAPQNLPRIFDRFYQADEGQRNVGGAGIGLAIVHELITLMQGSISVESEVGQGTEFTLLLPITQKAPMNETPSLLDMKEKLPFELLSEDVQADEKMVRTGEKPLLLVVEDNVDVVTYLSSFLMEEYQLLTAGNGRAGIELAIENIPDIILSDVMMPEKDGFELCQALKTDERTSHIPIILLTAKADIASKLEGLEFGADAYLTKPVNREELELRLRKLLESRKLLQEYYFKIYPEGDKKEVYQREDAFMEKLHEIMDAHLDDENFGIKDICQEMFISRMQLHRKLRALTGKTTSHYLRTYRLQKARKMLLNSNMTITEIAYEVGFKSPGYFSSSFTETFGKSPLEFRK